MNVGIFKNRDFTLLSIGQSISNLAQSMIVLAQSLFVLKLERPVVGLGTLLILMALPWIIFGPVAGYLSDNYKKRTFIILSDFCFAILALGLIVTSSITVFYIITFLKTCVDVFFKPASGSYLPHIFAGDENLTQANSIYAIIVNFGVLLGPVLSGFIISKYTEQTVFFIAAILFVIAFISQLFLREPGLSADDKKERGSVFSNIKSGLKFLVGYKELLYIVSFVCLSAFGFGAISVIYPNYLRIDLGISESLYGTYTALINFGALLSGLLLIRLVRRLGDINVIFLSSLLSGVFYFILSFGMNSGIMAVIILLLGISNAMLSICNDIHLQIAVPREKLGRVYSIDTAIYQIIMTAGILFATLLGESADNSFFLRWTAFGLIIFTIISTAYYFRKKYSTT